MQPPGLAAFERRTDDRSMTYSYEQRQAAALTPAERKALKTIPAAWAFFESQPPSYRRIVAWWIQSAKREETRKRRLAVLVDCSAHGQLIPLIHPEAQEVKIETPRSRRPAARRAFGAGIAGAAARRPAGTQRPRDAVRRDGAQRDDCDQPAACLRRRPAGAARGWKCRRRRRHGCRGALGRRADDERDRRRPVRDRLRPEGEGADRPQRERAGRPRGDARGVREARRHPDARVRPAHGDGAGCRGRLGEPAEAARDDHPGARAGSGDRLRARRLPGLRDHRGDVEGRGEAAGGGPGGRGDVPGERPRPRAGRDLPQPPPCRHPRADRGRRT